MILKTFMRVPFKWLLVGMGIGTLLLSVPQVAQSQTSGANREAVRALNLSRSQIREMRSVMQSYQSELNDILTSEQLEQFEALQAERREEPTANTSVDLASELNLKDDQASQLTTLQEGIAEDFQEILSAAQLQQAQELGFPGL
ncbi:MAG: hypothetical protein ACFB2W_10455 [Leptolyngbyaceae cyanobacterium]